MCVAIWYTNLIQKYRLIEAINRSVITFYDVKILGRITQYDSIVKCIPIYAICRNKLFTFKARTTLDRGPLTP